jgi:hypothetical protein
MTFVFTQTERIVGRYTLYNKRSDNPEVQMTIQAVNETTFEIRGDGWIGLGTLSKNKGYYDFEFTNGDSGRTAFRINKEGDLEGDVKFNEENLVYVNLDWKYIAKREE